ncbi:MAG: hypothetical protein COB78_00485 [Hyphomicrobiales bacterium]|nr:MAG: hypothetical protein COB78_00485 [Hyphomicrobiales bacterium]
MNIERILGGGAAIFGAFLLLYLIPNFVTDSDGMMSPTLFPSIAAWMFILFGSIQAITSSEPLKLPSAREFIRSGMIALIVLAAILAMEWLGFLIVATAFMAILTMFMYERRPIWLVATIIVMPICVWLVFELLLRRPLPPMLF